MLCNAWLTLVNHLHFKYTHLHIYPYCIYVWVFPLYWKVMEDANASVVCLLLIRNKIFIKIYQISGFALIIFAHYIHPKAKQHLSDRSGWSLLWTHHYGNSGGGTAFSPCCIVKISIKSVILKSGRPEQIQAENMVNAIAFWFEFELQYSIMEAFNMFWSLPWFQRRIMSETADNSSMLLHDGVTCWELFFFFTTVLLLSPWIQIQFQGCHHRSLYNNHVNIHVTL